MRGRHAIPERGRGSGTGYRWSLRRWTPGTARAVAVVLLGLMFLVTWWWWQGRPRQIDVVGTGQVAESAVASPTPGAEAPAVTAVTAGDDTITVHVIGRVRRPGVVLLPAGSRVADAVNATGGMQAGFTRTDLNLARLLVDGEQIVVRRRSAPRTPAGSTSAPSSSVLDLNSADAASLETLPGIGPVLAGRIIAWRDLNGPFPSVDVLGEVSGIGPVLLENLRPLVRV